MSDELEPIIQNLIRHRQFFSGPLKQFEKTETFTSIRGKKLTRLKNADIIDGEFRCSNLILN